MEIKPIQSIKHSRQKNNLELLQPLSFGDAEIVND